MVFVVESAFSSRDYKRFGLERLQRSGISVAVWDISALTLPRARVQWSRPPAELHPEIVTSQEGLTSLVSGLCADDTLVFIALVYTGSSASSPAILDVMLKSPAVATAIAAGHLPSLSRSSRWRLRVDRLLRNPLEFVRLLALHRRFSRSILGSHSRKREDETGRANDSALDRVWAATEVSEIRPELFDERTVIRYIHSLDYDAVLELPDVRFSGQPFSVFLDTMGPFHPDYFTHDVPYRLEMESFSRIVCDHLTQIESQLGTKTVIAAHPRAKPGLMEPHYGGRQVLYGRTAELIADAQLVVAAGASTSIGMAAVLRKPLSLITLLPLNVEEQAYRKAFIRELQLNGASLEAPRPGWEIPQVNEAAYGQFVEKYIKRPGTPERPFWDVVAEDVLSYEARSN